MRLGLPTRWLPLALGLVLAVSLAACDRPAEAPEAQQDDDPTAAAEDGEFDWRRHDGQTIRLVANQHPWQEAIEPLLGDFEELTGITVEIEALPEEQFRQRLQTELTAGSDDIDVYMSAMMQDGARFHQAGWYEDLLPYAENASLTSPDYDFDDFGDGVIEGHTFDGQLVALPIQVETQMLYYRKDILEEHGLDVPTTFEELEQVAQTIDDPDGVRAYSARGRRAATVTQFAVFLYNHGAEYIDDQGKAAFNTPEGIEAFETYGRLVREYGPPGAANNSWEELLPLFQQGQLAMWPDASAFLPQVIDESESTVVDTVGFAPMPAGPADDAQGFFNWAIAMSSNSQNKEPAWYFIQWATSPDVVQELQTIGVVGGRESVPFGEQFPEDWVEAFQASLPKARRQLPAVIPVPEIRDAIGDAVVTAIEGGDVPSAVERAAQEFDRIVETGG